MKQLCTRVRQIECHRPTCTYGERLLGLLTSETLVNDSLRTATKATLQRVVDDRHNAANA